MDKFTKKAALALSASQSIASMLGHTYIGSEHLLLGIAKQKDSVGARILNSKGINYDRIKDVVVRKIGQGEKQNISASDMSPKCKKIIENSFIYATKYQSLAVGTEHLLMALIKQSDCSACGILNTLNIDCKALFDLISDRLDINDITNSFDKSQTLNRSNKMLSKYGVNLNQLASKGKLQKLIGRKEEIERIMSILVRKTKNNPVIVGEPGVGKTIIVEGLADMINKNKVPGVLRDKQIIMLDICQMIAGAKYRGEFEDRLKNVIDEAQKCDNVILFIDEIHSVIGAGAAEGAIDAANILKPALARGVIKVIGATTIDEYHRHIERDSALERRFAPIICEEPSEEETLEILKGIRENLESHHNAKITDEALTAAIKLTNRYIQDRFLPDKAIDVIDEAASRARLVNANREIELIEFEKAVSEKNVNLAKRIRDSYISSEKIIIDKEDISNIVSAWTGIPTGTLQKSQSEQLLELDKVLSKNIIGQDEAIKSLCNAIKRARVGIKDPSRPIGSFLFAGPTGVGKTELCKVLARALFNDEGSLIKIDMSEYMEMHSVSKLIGSPPGYIGFEMGGGLTEKIRSHPYSVVLFDEIEKAHPDVLNILLGVLEDGVLYDSFGKCADFKNTVIIMTSNIGAKKIISPKTVGFDTLETDKNNEVIKENVLKEIKENLKSEFINRIDKIIIFDQLTKNDVIKISKLMLDELSERLMDLGIQISFEDDVALMIAKLGYSREYGARPIRRVMQNIVEDKIAADILSKKINVGDKVVFSADYFEAKESLKVLI